MNNYSISEKIDGSANKYRVHCFNPNCGRPIEKGQGFPIWVESKGKRYVCCEHRNWSHLLSYHANARARRNGNDVTIGTNKITPLANTTVGVEIECNGRFDAIEITSLRLKLESAFFVRGEHDATVDAEFPTSKMQGLATISKVLQSMEKRDLLKYVSGESCGAHIHCGTDKIEYIRRYYHTLFVPLCIYFEHLGAEKRIQYFGSDFRYYAHRINRQSEPMEHENFINTQHEHTLEFRLPRIKTYLQYMDCIKFWREVVCFINHFDFDENNESNACRLVQARKCSAQIVEIAKKYFH